MPFCGRDRLDKTFRGKTVAIVGSGPGALDNPAGKVDGHDVVVRVNNYKLIGSLGKRTDVFYSFFGGSIRKEKRDLVNDGVKLCIAKCPKAKIMDSAWHAQHGKMNGVDFRKLYERRHNWWFCDTYLPTVEEFMEKFHLLGGHVPTTGFSAILDIMKFDPARLYLTGFDFFTSKIHNANEKWKPGCPDDPIGHDPVGEASWLAKNMTHYPIECDARLLATLSGVRYA